LNGFELSAEVDDQEAMLAPAATVSIADNSSSGRVGTSGHSPNDDHDRAPLPSTSPARSYTPAAAGAARRVLE